MDRRGFLGSILTACAAPAIVRADSLMRIIPRDAQILIEAIPPLEMHPDGFYLEWEVDTFPGFTGMHDGILYVNGHVWDFAPEEKSRQLRRDMEFAASRTIVR